MRMIKDDYLDDDKDKNDDDNLDANLVDADDDPDYYDYDQMTIIMTVWKMQLPLPPSRGGNEERYIFSISMPSDKLFCSYHTSIKQELCQIVQNKLLEEGCRYLRAFCNAVFGGKVSVSVWSVVVLFFELDPFSSNVSLDSYINRTGIDCR